LAQSKDANAQLRGLQTLAKREWVFVEAVRLVKSYEL